MAGIEAREDWIRLVLGLFVVFGLFHGVADRLGSDRGQAGILVGILIVAATAGAERILIREPNRTTARRMGLGRPHATGMVAAGSTAAALLLVALSFCYARGMRLHFYPGWTTLLPGLFAQAGVAEEVLFRGYLFGHLRVGRTFWQAAAVSMLPFAAVHLVLFLSMAWPIALAAALLAIVISFPLAFLFELGGHTIWAPALLHFVIQGTVKVLLVEHGAESFALMWMIASAIVPMLIFAVMSPDATRPVL